MTFYVYEHWRPDKNVCFYVGKGKGRRAYIFNRKTNSYYIRIKEKLDKLGFKIEVKFVKKNLDQEAALKLEINRIKILRKRGIKLTNLTDGGAGTKGHYLSIRARRNISKANRGIKRSAEHRAAISKAQKGRTVSKETREKLRLALLGNKNGIGHKITAKGKEKLFKIHFGSKRSEKSKAKLRAAWRKRRLIPFSEETRKRMSIAMSGRKFTKEHKAKIGIAAKGNLYNLGRKHTEIARKNMSIAQQKRSKENRKII